MAVLLESARKVLFSNAWYSGLPAELRTQIEQRSAIKTMKDGERLYTRNAKADAWYCVLCGAIKVSNTTREGKEFVLTYVEPGAWFGEISLFDGLPRTHDGSAHGSTDVLRLPATAFAALIDEFPVLCVRLMQVQCQRLRLLFTALEDQTSMPTECRLARQLLGLARNYGVDVAAGRRISLKLPQDELAQLMGVTRQSINKLLKAWEREGLVAQHYGEITLTDVQGMEARAA